MSVNENNDHIPEDNKPDAPKHPQSNERVPGQGNSNDGLTRRLGGDIESRGIKEHEKLQKGEGFGEQERPREGSQGVSRGQETD